MSSPSHVTTADTAYKGNDDKLTEVAIQEVPVTPPGNDHSPSTASTKACFAFRDNAHKEQSRPAPKPLQPKPAEEPTPPTLEDQKAIRRQVRIVRMRMGQHVLTSLLSVAIASLQFAAYIIWNKTKNVPGAWPSKPDLMPTLMLAGVALGALVIDICMIIIHCVPGNAAARAEKLGGFMMYVITGIKYTAYAVAATACRSVFATGGNNDLWGYSCRVQHPDQGANTNCAAQTAAWALAITQIVLEGANVMINLYAKYVKNGETSTEGGEGGATSPLLKRTEKMEAIVEDSQDQLHEMTPSMK